MTYPQFLDIESSSPDDDRYPTQVSWSLTDGSIKTALILPDDNWEPWDNCSPELDVQHLMDHGSTPSDIIRELNDDLSGQTVFVDGLDEDEALIEQLYESALSDPDFELARADELNHQDFESFLQSRQEKALEYDLDLAQTEDAVRALLFVYHEHIAAPR